MFQKIEVSKLQSQISSFGKKQAELQALLTGLIAQCVYQSVAHNNVDPGIKLIGALFNNGYNRTNDTITFLCKMGNFAYKKDVGIFFKAHYAKNEALAVELAEKALSNPMFTIVNEQKVAQDLDLTRAFKALVAKAKATIKEGKAVLADDDKEMELFRMIEDYVATKSA